MKTTLITLSLFALSCFVKAQAPQAFKYQGIARNASGNALSNQKINIKVTIHDGSASGTNVYQETHVATTNPLGLFNVNIGEGSAISGTFANINWSSGSKFIEQEVDFGNGTYQNLGTSPFLSVPYALYAENGKPGPVGPQGPAGVVPNGTTPGNTPYWNGTSWITSSSNIFNNGENVGIGGILTPQSNLHLHSSSTSSNRMLFTNQTTGATASDGFIAGIGSNSDAFILQNESQPLWFGTAGTEKMRIEASGKIGINNNSPLYTLHVTDVTGNGISILGESNNANNSSIYTSTGTTSANAGFGYMRQNLLKAITGINSKNDWFLNVGYISNAIYVSQLNGNVGINTNAPARQLDVNGTARIGANGTTLTNIIKLTVNADIPLIISGTSVTQTFTVSGAALGSTVAISPDQALPNNLFIAYARVSAANTVEMKILNGSSLPVDLAAMNWYITVIQ